MKKIMANSLKVIPAVLLLMVAFFAGCAEDPSPVLWDDPTYKGGAAPVISAITPADSAFAVVDEITITGTNFLPDTTQTSVYFNNKKVQITALSATSITVISPNIVSDSIMIRVVTQNSVEMSNKVPYKLLEGFGPYFAFKEKEDKPTSMTFNKNGDLYVSMIVNGVGAGVKRVYNDNGELKIADYAPKGAETNWSGLKFGRDGILYGSKKLRGIWQINAGVAPTNAPWVQTAGNVSDFDFDQNGQIWAAGIGANVYNIDPATKVVTNTAFQMEVISVRVFGDKLLLGGKKDGKQVVYEFTINGKSLTNGRVLLDVTALEATFTVSAITVASDGTIYIGGNGADPIIQLTPAGTASYLFAGRLIPTALAFGWAPGSKYMLYTKEGTPQTIYRVFVGKTTAPFYGLGN